MLFPKKVKHRKWQTGRKSPEKLARPDTRGVDVSFGSYGLRATTPSRVTSNQIEAARKKITYMTKRAGKYWVRVFPHKPITKKPVGVKMGSGKGAIETYVAVVRPGTILFELGGVTESTARTAFTKASHKLSVQTTFVSKE